MNKHKINKKLNFWLVIKITCQNIDRSLLQQMLLSQIKLHSNFLWFFLKITKNNLYPYKTFKKMSSKFKIYGLRKPTL